MKISDVQQLKTISKRIFLSFLFDLVRMNSTMHMDTSYLYIFICKLIVLLLAFIMYFCRIFQILSTNRYTTNNNNNTHLFYTYFDIIIYLEGQLTMIKILLTQLC